MYRYYVLVVVVARITRPRARRGLRFQQMVGRGYAPVLAAEDPGANSTEVAADSAVQCGSRRRRRSAAAAACALLVVALLAAAAASPSRVTRVNVDFYSESL